MLAGDRVEGTGRLVRPLETKDSLIRPDGYLWADLGALQSLGAAFPGHRFSSPAFGQSASLPGFETVQDQ